MSLPFYPIQIMAGIISELHVANQKLEDHQNLVFDPRTCQGLVSLHTLNTAGNKMLSLDPLQEIPRLSSLNASSNLLFDLESDVISVISKIPSLMELDLRANPISSTVRHWEEVVGSCANLSKADGKQVDNNCRTMMRNMRQKRLQNKAPEP